MHSSIPKIKYKGRKPLGYTRKRDEEQMQIALMHWASYHPICKDYLFHMPNERKCSISEGVRQKALGLRAGVSDLFLAWPTKRFPGLWIELKVNDNKLTKMQVVWLELMEKAGYATAVVYDDWEKVKLLIEQYLDDSFEMP